MIISGIIGISGIIVFLIKKGTFIKRPLNILYFFTFYLLPFIFYLLPKLEPEQQIS
ncbi:hypothetical protein HMPREF1321_0629 [Capnocytophaga sp. oral taxon 412 str. F0487]|nr:hypothetical protein HMPREF1321_0629 [Capnocytophaga sp. oral taxon 412 str. F0487]